MKKPTNSRANILYKKYLQLAKRLRKKGNLGNNQRKMQSIRRLFRYEKQLQRLGIAASLSMSLLSINPQLNAQAAPFLAEFQVNTATLSLQENASVAADAEGNFVAVWQSFGQDGSGAGIYGQRYHKDGSKAGDEFKVNASTISSQINPNITMNADGNFVVTWQSNALAANLTDIQAKYYASDGSTIRGEFKVNLNTEDVQRNPNAAIDAEGNFVIVWESANQDGSSFGVVARCFNTNGIPVVDDFLVNTATNGSQSSPSVGMDIDGDFVVAWQSYGQDGSAYGVYGQRFEKAAIPQGTEFQINTETNSSQRNPNVVLAEEGDFVVVWQSYNQDGLSYDIYGQQYNKDGIKMGAEFQVNTATTNNQRFPEVAIDADGDFVVVWQSAGQDGDSYGIYGQRYNSNGGKTSEEFQINTATSSSQRFPSVATDAHGNFVVVWQSLGQDGSVEGVYGQQYRRSPETLLSNSEFIVNTETVNSKSSSAVAMDAAGNHVVVWASNNQDGDGSGIYGQRYNSDGVKIGDEFQVNTTTTDAQRVPSIAIDTDGDFVVVWQSLGQDGSGYGVYGQRYNSSGNKVGNEFRINTETADDQRKPKVAMEANGDFVVVWDSDAQDGASTGIYGQRYNSNGNKIGGEFRINTETMNAQRGPSLAMNTDGNFVVVWESSGQDGSDTGVYGQRYNSSGSKVGSEFRVNTLTEDTQNIADVAMDEDGSFVVVWQSWNQDGDRHGVYGQRYGSNGLPIGEEFQINTMTISSQRDPEVAMDADGNFAVVWQSRYQDGSNYSIYAQRYNNNGKKVGSEFQINTETLNNQLDPNIAMDMDGNFVVAWRSDAETNSLFQVYAKSYHSACGTHPVGEEFQVNIATISAQRDPRIATDRNGNFVIVWESVQDGDDFGIYGQLYNSNGTKISDEFQINTRTIDNQSNPSVAMDEDGSFVVVWQSFNQDGSGDGIYGQRYSSNGSKLDGEFRVNNETNNSQINPSIAIDEDKEFVVVWQSSNQDGSGSGVYGQRFNVNGSKVGGEFRVNTATNDDQSNPSVAMDEDGNFVVAWDSYGQDGSGKGVYGQRYQSNGNPVGVEFQINTATGEYQSDPSVAMDADGNFTVVWESYAQENNYSGIYGQQYSKSGTKVGSEFRASKTMSNNQFSPRISMNANGDFVVIWESAGQDGSSFGVYGQSFDRSGNPNCAEFQVNTYTMSSQRLPDVIVNSNGDFVVVWQSFEQDGDNEGVYAQRYKGTTSTPCSAFPLTLSSTVSSAEEYITQETITSTQVIESNAIVLYQAATDITLEAGFHAKAASVFTAKIEDCAVASSTNQKPIVEARSADMRLDNPLPPTNQLLIYPNPAIAQIQFTVPKASTVTSIALYDQFGKLLKQISTQERQLSLQDLVAGLYILVVTTEEGYFSEKVVKL